MSESFDPEGTELTFAWSVLPKQGVVLSGADSKAVISFAIPGQYSVNVKVTDGDGGESEIVRQVTVYGSQGFSSFKQNYLDDFWETKNIEVEDNTPEGSSYSLETVDGQLHINRIRHRRTTNDTCSHLNVLFSDGSNHIHGCQTTFSHFFRVQPDTHRVVT